MTWKGKKMLIFNIQRDCVELAKEIGKCFENSEIVEVDSLATDTVIQVIVPILTVSIPALSSIIIKAMSVSSKVEVEWNGIKIKGTEKQVEKFLTKIVSLNSNSLKETKDNKKRENP